MKKNRAAAQRVLGVVQELAAGLAPARRPSLRMAATAVRRMTASPRRRESLRSKLGNASSTPWRPI